MAQGEIKKIMVPLDGSKLAESIMPLVANLAGGMGAKLVLLHIVEQRAPQTRHGEPHLTTANDAEAYLGKLAQEYALTAEVETHVHGVEENNVAQGIAEHVAELGADMVALCTHGRSDIRRVMWGSIAQLVLRRVSVPVLVGRPQEPPVSKVGSILVMLDSEHRAEQALAIAAQMARSCSLPIRLISVVPTAETLTGDRLASARLIPLSTAAALDAEQQASAGDLERFAQALRGQGLEVEVAVQRGEITPTLAGAAHAQGDALVIMTTHARAGLDAALSGSVVQGVITRTTQPLLLVKVPHEQG